MEYSNSEIKRYIKKVVSETKDTSREDTGFLKRSIRGNWFNGIATFREIFYGAYNNNAKLVENAKAIMPKDIPWQVIFVDEEGRETPIEGKTRTGRKISRKSVSNENISTKNIKALINSIKLNGEKKNDTGKGN
jgi:hypothetical protein